MSVHPSVCLSVKRVHCDKTKERSVQIFYTLRKIIQPSFLKRKMVGGGDRFYLKFWVSRTTVGAKSTTLNRYSLVAPHPKHLAKKVQLTLIGSPLYALSNEPKMIVVRSP